MQCLPPCCNNICCCECNCIIFPAPNPAYTSKYPNLAYFVNFSSEQVPYYEQLRQRAQLHIMYFHGNAEDIGHVDSFLQPIADKLQANVYAMEYPLYGVYESGLSGGISDRIKADSLQFFQHLVRKQGVNSSNTLVIGRSIGTGGAAYLAANKHINNLVLISPFSTIPNVAADIAGCLGCLLKCHFDNLEQVSRFRGRLLVIHGRRDEVIGFRHGEMVRDRYNQGYGQGGCVFRAPAQMSHNSFDYGKDIMQPIVEFGYGIAHGSKV